MMSNEFFKKIIKSLHEWEKDDFDSICCIIDKRKKQGNVAVVSDNPYLFFLIFLSLIRWFGVEIHILNPAEGTTELQRLLSVIDPDYVVVTDATLKERLHGYKIIVANEQAIVDIEDEVEYSQDPGDLDFTIVTYSPFPTKIHRVSGEMFRAMVEGVVQDLFKFSLVGIHDNGLIPFISNNPDYLLYYVAIKLANFSIIVRERRILPTNNEYNFPVFNKKGYLQHNRSKTLFIPKKEFLTLWADRISVLFENKFIFRSHLKERWFVNMMVRRRLKRLFEGFANVLIIGTLDNAYMVNILKNLSFVRFYSIFPIRCALMYGPISNSLEHVTLSTNEYRQDTPKALLDTGLFKGKPISLMNFKLFHPENDAIYTLTDHYSRFIEGASTWEDSEQKRHFYYLGNIENSLDKESGFIFPETLERVINSYPFIRNCVLLTFKEKVVLVLHPNMDILDSNRINYKMFKAIIQKQIDALNKELPDSYKIQGFVITTSLIEQDRDGEIVRFPFNYCNKWGG